MILGRQRIPTAQEGKPRASGDDPWRPPDQWWSGCVNPARAGMIRGGLCGACRQKSKPRASGDDPTTAQTSAQVR